MNNQLEVRVNKLEGITGKLAGVMSNLQNGQKTMVEVLHDLSFVIADEIREQISQEILSQKEQFKQEFSEDITQVKTDVEGVKEKLKQTTIDRHQEGELTQLRKSRIMKLVGGMKSPEYTLFYSRYVGKLTNDLKSYFKVSSYKDISLEEFDSAKNYINSWIAPSWYTKYLLDELKEKSENGELKISEQKALNEYLNF